MNDMRLSKWIVCLLLSLALWGCGYKPTNVGGVVSDDLYKTSVSLSPSATEIIRGRCQWLEIKGRTAACNYPAGLEQVPVVMNGVKPNYEAIAAAQPDVVVYDPDLFNEQDLEKFKELGIDTFAIGGSTVEEFVDRLMMFAALTKAEPEMSEYVDKIHAASQQAAGAPLDPRPTVAVLIPGEGSEHMIAGLRSFQADVVRKSGGEPIGPDAKMFVPVNAEMLLQWNPDAILVAGSVRAIAADPRLASLKALKSGRTAEIVPDVMLRRGVRVDVLIREVYGFLGRTNPPKEGSE